MNINFSITFLDYWHLSSGLSAGANGDSLVTKDNDNLPYIPAKTIKGLLREIAELKKDDDFINTCFGKTTDDGKSASLSQCYFSNAYIDENIKQEIISNNLQNNLYDSIAFTKIDKDAGIAKDFSLREFEVVVPLMLYGCIENVPDKYKNLMQESLASIKEMGLNRNRGLGRCKVEIGEQNG